MKPVHYAQTCDNGEASDCPATLLDAVEHAASILRMLPAEPDETDAARVRDLYQTLAHAIRWHLPQVTLWCVVKHYADHDPATGLWAPAIWCAFLSREQAESFRTAIDEHYTAQARARGWRLDGWTVERRAARPTDIIHPNLTPTEYIQTVL